MSSLSRRRSMVADLVRRGSIRSPAVKRAFLEVPREVFLPGRRLEQVYSDQAIVTRRDASGAPISSSSQPAIMAHMLERLELEPGMRVLEVGAGTGYNAALLQAIVGPSGRVRSIDIDRSLVRDARRALRQTGSVPRVVAGDGRLGSPSGAPYDRIVVTASTARIPRAWIEQLSDGGLLEVPLRLSDAMLNPQVVAALQRKGKRLESVTAVCGGFMGLRDHAGDSAPEWPFLSVTDSDGRTRRGRTLLGAGLARMDAAARGRVAGLLLSNARRSRVASGPELWSLGAFVATRGPSDALVDVIGGTGFATTDGRSLAVVTMRTARPAAATSQASGTLSAWGSPTAERMLRRVLDEWRALGRPGVDRMRITATLGRTSLPRYEWPS